MHEGKLHTHSNVLKRMIHGIRYLIFDIIDVMIFERMCPLLPMHVQPYELIMNTGLREIPLRTTQMRVKWEERKM